MLLHNRHISCVISWSPDIGVAGQKAKGACLLAGDLNSRPESLEMRLLGRLLGGLRDCWHQACPSLPGFTSNLDSNTFREVPVALPVPVPKSQ